MERVSVLVQFDCPNLEVQLQSPPSREEPSAHWQDKLVNVLKPLGEETNTFRCVLFGSLVEVVGHLWQHQMLWVHVKPMVGQTGEESFLQADFKDIVEPAEVEEVERNCGVRYHNTATLYDDLGPGKVREVTVGVTLELIRDDVGLAKAALQPTINEVFVLRLQQRTHKGSTGGSFHVRFGGIRQPLRERMDFTLVLVGSWAEVPKALTELDACVQAPIENDVVDLPIGLFELVKAAAERGGADGVAAGAKSDKLPGLGECIGFDVSVQSFYWSSKLGRLQVGRSKDSEELWAESILIDPRTWRMSVEIRSLRLTSGSSANAFVMYSYDLLQQPRPFRTNPPVLARKNQTVYLPQAFVAYTLAATAEEIQARFEDPLRVEVWHRDLYKKDSLIGLVEFAFGNIFDRPIQYSASMPSMVSGFRVLDQVCDVIGVGNSEGKIGALRLLLFVEDLGPASTAAALQALPPQMPPAPAIAPPAAGLRLGSGSSNRPVTPALAIEASNETPAGGIGEETQGINALEGLQALRSSPEYSAAFELELWKRSEEEKFRTFLKGQESAMRQQLDDEYRQKELQRAKEFRMKQNELKDLEAKVRKKFQDMQQREVTLVANETRDSALRDEMKRRTDMAIQEHEDASKRQVAEIQHSLKMERDKVQRLEAKLEEADAELASFRLRLKDMEIEADERRKKMEELPVSKVQQELHEVQLQLRDTERRCEALAASRDHFRGKVEELCHRFLRQPPPSAAPTAALPIATETTESDEKIPEQGMQDMLQALRKMQDHLGELTREYGTSSSHSTAMAAPVRHPGPAEVAGYTTHIRNVPMTAPPYQVSSHNPQNHSLLPPRTISSDAAAHLSWLQSEREELLQSGLYNEGDPVLRAIDARISEALTNGSRASC